MYELIIMYNKLTRVKNGVYRKDNNGMANDVRTQVTKRLLKEAFHSMIEKDMENEITVKALCKMAQVSRVTFYTHYKDIYEMIVEDQTENLRLLGIEELYQSKRCYQEITEELILRLLVHIDTNDKLYRYYFSVIKDNYMEIIIRDLLSHISTQAGEYAKTMHPETVKMFVNYHAAGIIQIMRQWMDYKGQKPCTREVYARELVSVMFYTGNKTGCV